MDQNEKALSIGERFTLLAREGKIEYATEYYAREARFADDEVLPCSESADLRTPPMNELYKGIKE